MTRFEKIKSMGLKEIVDFIDRTRKDPLIAYATKDEIRNWLNAEEGKPLFSFVGKPGRYLVKENAYSDVRILSHTTMFGQPYVKIAMILNGLKVITVPEMELV